MTLMMIMKKPTVFAFSSAHDYIHPQSLISGGFCFHCFNYSKRKFK